MEAIVIHHSSTLIDLDVHVLVQLAIGCVHVVMANRNADTNIVNKHH
jgi:hypothetical protein